jgi:hypothetical protein
VKSSRILGLLLVAASISAAHALDCTELFVPSLRIVTIPSAGCELRSLLTIRQAGLEIRGETATAAIRLLAPEAGVRIENAANVHIRSLAITSSVTSNATNSIFVIGDSPGFAAADIEFSGGGVHLSLNGARDFLIQRTRHRGPRTSGYTFYCYQCHHGIIDSPQIDGYVVPSGGPFRAIELLQSEDIHVVEPMVRDIDASSQPSFSGIEFVDSDGGSITGGRISGLINGDGITIGHARGVTISGVTIENNSGHPRKVPGGATGSGIDVFGAADTIIVGCIVRHNGHTPTPESRHYGLELYESDGVLVVDTVVEDSGVNGIVLYGSRDVKLISVSASRNRNSGLKAFAASGKAEVTGRQLSVALPQTFGKQWRRGTPLRLANKIRHVDFVRGNQQLILQEDGGSGRAVSWSVESSLLVVGGHFSGNGLGREKREYRDGLTITDRTQAVLVGVDSRRGGSVGSDRQPSQLEGVHVYSDAEVLRNDDGADPENGSAPHLQ